MSFYLMLDKNKLLCFVVLIYKIDVFFKTVTTSGFTFLQVKEKDGKTCTLY